MHRGDRTPVYLTVDYRGDGSFGGDVARALDVRATFLDAAAPVRMVDVNQPLDEVRQEIDDGVVWVVADAFAPESEGGVEFPGRHGVRAWLDAAGARYVGSRYEAAAGSSSGDKIECRRRLAPLVAVPRGCGVPQTGPVPVDELIAAVGLPAVAKRAVGSGASVGVHHAATREALEDAVTWERQASGGPVIVEKYVTGREHTVWILEHEGRPAAYAVAELRHPGRPLFDQDAKHRSAVVARGHESRDGIEVIVEPPGAEPAVVDAALAAHAACGLRHYSRIDVITSGRVPAVIDVNAAPVVDDSGLGAIAALQGDRLGDLLTRLVAGVAAVGAAA